MPRAELEAQFAEALQRHRTATAELVPLLIQMAVATLAEVLPGASQIDAFGELNEDWVPTLRTRHVLDAGGNVLFDVEEGHSDHAVEDTVDTVDIEYLDVLVDVTGDQYMGRVTIS